MPQPTARQQAQQAAKDFNLDALARVCRRQGNGWLSTEHFLGLATSWIRNGDDQDDQIIAGLELLIEATGDRANTLDAEGSHLLSQLFYVDRKALLEWGRRQPLAIERTHMTHWYRQTMMDMSELDLHEQLGWVVNRNHADRFESHLAVLALMRGDDMDTLGPLLKDLQHMSMRGVACQVAYFFYHRWGDGELMDSVQITPHLEGLAWLGRLCANKVLRQGAADNMMDDEFQEAVLEPFIDQVRAAPAELERQRMEAMHAASGAHQQAWAAAVDANGGVLLS